MKKDNAKKGYVGKIIAAFLLGAVIMTFVRYISYGGMNAGTQVNNEEFLKVAEDIDDIVIPENVKIYLKMVASEVVPDYIVPVIRQGAEDGSIHTECPEEIADLLMFLTDVWINPIIYQMSDEQMVRRIQLINDMFKPYGIDLIHEDMVQLMRECRNVQCEK